MPTYTRIDPEVRFFAKVKMTDGCWYWTAGLNAWGYGTFHFEDRDVRAHRFMWEQVHGPIPDALTIHHKCYTKNCVRPDHLMLMTMAENIADSNRQPWHGRITPGLHCRRGHALTPDNTYVFPGRNGKRRTCRICLRASHKAWDAKQRGAS